MKRPLSDCGFFSYNYSMQKREAQFGLLFRAWLRAHPMRSAGFELKQTTSNSIPFSAVKEHQLDALLAVKHRSILYKAPDDSRGAKPFDYFYLNNAEAYIVIRYPKAFYIMDVNAFIVEKENSTVRSLTSERACAISLQTVILS